MVISGQMMLKSNLIGYAIRKKDKSTTYTPTIFPNINFRLSSRTIMMLFCTSEIMLIASVIDKVAMQNRYPEPWYPPAIAYETLLQRVDNEMDNRGTVTVSMDDMTGATPKGNQYKKNLNAQHERMKKTGSFFLKNVKFQCIKGRLRFVNSAQSHLIQVADIAAYNVYRQLTDYGGKLGRPHVPIRKV